MRLTQQLLTANECYQLGRPLTVQGVMIHSTGANNPNVSRYVPGSEVLGRNTAGSHWDRFRPDGRQVCVHAFVGKFADGEVGTVQTLPWEMRGWHAGNSRGNGRYIGFEICEDALEDGDYFSAVYRESVELTAMLCRRFDLDPLKEGTVLCHAEGHRIGVASNHADVLHWFPRHGKSMDSFRADVARLMKEEDEDMSYEQFKAYMTRYEQELAGQQADGWAGEGLARAVSLGITDGTRPKCWVTRQEAALMAAAAKSPAAQ